MMYGYCLILKVQLIFNILKNLVHLSLEQAQSLNKSLLLLWESNALVLELSQIQLLVRLMVGYMIQSII